MKDEKKLQIAQITKHGVGKKFVVKHVKTTRLHSL